MKRIRVLASALLAFSLVAPALPAQAAPAGVVDKDLDGDGVADLVVAGGPGTGFGSGVWTALGRNNGRVRTPAAHIGELGYGLNGTAESFDGTQVFSGRFSGGEFDDFAAYITSGPQAGYLAVVRGTGDGGMRDPRIDGNGWLSDQIFFQDPAGNSPRTLVNAFGADGDDTGFPDLLGITGDDVNGYGLAYYANLGTPALTLWSAALSNATPTGDHAWQDWQLFSTETTGGIALFLRHVPTGAVHLWSGVSVADGALAYTQHRVAAGGVTGALQAADVNADGLPDLWAVAADGSYRAYVIRNLKRDGTARVKVTAARPLGQGPYGKNG